MSEFLEAYGKVQREVFGLRIEEILELIVEARLSLKRSDDALKAAVERIHDYEEAMYRRVPDVLSYAESGFNDIFSTGTLALTVNWKTPELVLLIDRLGHLQSPQNMERLIEVTTQAWAKRMAASLFATVYERSAA